MQSNLRSLFAGKREAVELPKPRGPGRPKKLRTEEAPAPGVVLEAVAHRMHQHEEVEAQIAPLGERKAAMRLKMSSVSDSLVEALGVAPAAELRMLGARVLRRNEGPQVRLQLWEWWEERTQQLGGTAEAEQSLFASVGEQWGLSRKGVEEIPEPKALWEKPCRERGVSSKGLLHNEAQLPKALRTSRRSTGTVMRAKGGGRQDPLKWAYPSCRRFLRR